MGRKKLVIIDGNSLANRAFYAIRTELTTTDGLPTNAIYGFTNMLVRLMDEENPDFLAVAFDKPGPTFRHLEYDEYKATRKGMPDELGVQMPLIKEILAAFHIPALEADGYEADDIIGTAAKKCEEAGHECLIITGDRDALQLVSNLTRAMLTKKGISETEIYDEEAVRKYLGVNPEYVPDIKGLAGDASDNIPGIPGIGEKTAVKLIKAFGNLEDILKNVDTVKPERTKRLLEEYRDQARLSKKLATIVREVPIDFDIEKSHIEEPNWADLLKLFRRLEFRKLIKRFENRSEKGGSNISPGTLNLFQQTTEDEMFSCLTVKDLGEVKDLNKKLVDAGEFAFEIISAGDNPMQSEIIGIAITYPGGQGFYLPFSHTHPDAPGLAPDETIKILKPAFEDKNISKICHDMKAKIIYLNRYGVELMDPVFDTMIASYLINPDKSSEIENIIGNFLGDEVPGVSSLYLRSGRGGLPKTVGEVEVGKIKDAACAGLEKFFELKKVLNRDLAGSDMTELFSKVEMSLARVLADMEMTGVKVDPEGLEMLSSDLGQRLSGLEKDIFRLAGDEFNINSPKQLSFVLFEKLGLPPVKKTKTGYSTDAEVLEALSFIHEIAGKVLDYRELIKLKTTYADALAALINPETGRIHTTFNQAVTSTGRLSSSDPNLQNIPIRKEEGRKIRAVFIPSDKNSVILSADYSQIELRVLAHFSGDEILTESFMKDEDIHARTAARVFGVQLKDVTADMRRKAKAVNFGIIYGISDFGLASGIGISRAEAAKFIETYFHHYQGVKKYLDEAIAKAREDGYVTTLLNRRRYLPDLRTNNIPRRKFAERTAMNTPIQGTAADIIKVAMINIAKRLKIKGFKAKMILQVHDELVFDVPKTELEEVSELVCKTMESAVVLRVPLKVDARFGPNWLELADSP